MILKNVLKDGVNYYNEKGGSYSLTYKVYASNYNYGVYNIRIVNAKDGKIIDTAKLTIGDGISPSNPSSYTPDYSVNVTDIRLKYGSSGSINMSISPIKVGGKYNYYRYAFFLKIYDSNNVEKISEYYSGETNTAFSKLYTISSYKLGIGVYTIKIIDHENNYIFDTSKLRIYDSSSKYSVNVTDLIICPTPDSKFPIYLISDSYEIQYDFKLGIYDSNNVLKISERYQGVTISGIIYVPIKNLDLGVYTIEIVDSKNNQVIDTAKLTIKSLPYYLYSVNVNDTNITCYENSRKISVSISYPGYANTIYKYDFYLKVYDSENLEVFSKRFYNTTKSYSKSCSFKSTSFRPGIYTIKIINVADNHLMDTAKLTVKSVGSQSYSVNIVDTIINYKSSDTFNISVQTKSYGYDFYLNVYDYNNELVLNKRYCYSKSYSGTLELKFNFNPGVYYIKILNSQDNRLKDTARLYVKSVSNSAYSVQVNDGELDYLSTGIIPLFISPALNDTYKYDFYMKIYDSKNVEIVSNRFYNTTASNLVTYQINSATLKPGVYKIKIFNSEDNYLMNSASLKINKIISNISSLNLTTNYKSNEKLVVTLKDVNGDVISGVLLSVNLDGVKVYSTDEMGQVMVSVSDLIPKTYVAAITFEGNEIYDKSTTVVNVTICKFETTMMSSDINVIYNSGKELVVTLKDVNGDAISGVVLSVDLDGIRSIVTNENGFARISTNGLVPKNYVATITFEGNEIYDKSTTVANVTISKSKTSILSSDINVIYNSGKELVVTLKDVNGNVISGAGVTVNLNGVKTYVTDSNGRVKVSTKGLIPKAYSVKVTFNGNDNYVKSAKDIRVTVKKATLKMTVKKKTFKNTVKNKKYVITLKDNTGKAMKKAKITLKIKGKKAITVKTNAKGKAIFKIKKLAKKGTYKTKVTYKGNAYYNKVIKKVKIKVK